MNTKICDIQRLSVNDGPGIRTTVFLKGCPLNCLWCHNPEAKHSYQELFFTESKCTRCGNCLDVCPVKSHVITEERHDIQRDLCIVCGKCAEACPYGALEIVGKSMTVDDVLQIVMRDVIFYKSSGGGMTLSGGEPLMHPEFSLELVKKGKENGLHICVETCGEADCEIIKSIMPYVDIFLYDYKVTNPEKHKEYTGVYNDRIISNLLLLDEAGAAIELRCPIIQGLNDTSEHFRGIAEMADRLNNLISVDVEPYHPLGKSKSQRLGREYPLNELGFASEQEVNDWVEAIQGMTCKKVQRV